MAGTNGQNGRNGHEPERDEHGNDIPRPVGKGAGQAREADRSTAKLVLEGGGSIAMAAEAAGVSQQAVSKWIAEWKQEGWTRPDVNREVVGRAAADQRWEDHRLRVGLKAGLVAERIIGRIANLVPQAGESEVVIEQALDIEGNPTGVPRHRVLTMVPSSEVQRLADAVGRLFTVADKSVGLDQGLEVTVNTRSAIEASLAGETTADRRRQVLDVFDQLELEEGES